MLGCCSIWAKASQMGIPITSPKEINQIQYRQTLKTKTLVKISAEIQRCNRGNLTPLSLTSLSIKKQSLHVRRPTKRANKRGNQVLPREKGPSPPPGRRSRMMETIAVLSHLRLLLCIFPFTLYIPINFSWLNWIRIETDDCDEWNPQRCDRNGVQFPPFLSLFVYVAKQIRIAWYAGEVACLKKCRIEGFDNWIKLKYDWIFSIFVYVSTNIFQLLLLFLFIFLDELLYGMGSWIFNLFWSDNWICDLFFIIS